MDRSRPPGCPQDRGDYRPLYASSRSWTVLSISFEMRSATFFIESCASFAAESTSLTMRSLNRPEAARRSAAAFLVASTTSLSVSSGMVVPLARSTLCRYLFAWKRQCPTRRGDDEADRFADALSPSSDPLGWYVNFHSDTDAVVVFSNRVFRYPRGDSTGQAQAQAYARDQGVP